MKIAVVCVEEIDSRPPVIELVGALLSLGHTVLVIGRNLCSLPVDIKNNAAVSIEELGKKSKGLSRILSSISDRRRIRKRLNRERDIDVLWAATDISVRECLSSAKRYKFVAQLPELVEFVPFLRLGEFYLKDYAVPAVVRTAACVVVPEYNRAHIQKIWWKLPQLPVVLPNKSALPVGIALEDTNYAGMALELMREKKKVLLYQGGFTSDRDLTPVVEALPLLDGQYALYIMGPINNEEESKRVDNWCQMSSDVHYVGFVCPPNHLLFTRYGHIGLLPYAPSQDKTRASSLNALYCAPNKIWEYSREGLPMIGSDVPGLASLFDRFDIGVTANLDSPVDIAEAIRKVEENYDEYSSNSATYYSTVDVRGIVEEILERCE